MSDALDMTLSRMTSVIMWQRMQQEAARKEQRATVWRNDLADHLLAISKHAGEAVDALLGTPYDHDAWLAKTTSMEDARDAFYATLRKIAEAPK